MSAKKTLNEMNFSFIEANRFTEEFKPNLSNLSYNKITSGPKNLRIFQSKIFESSSCMIVPDFYIIIILSGIG